MTDTMNNSAFFFAALWGSVALVPLGLGFVEYRYRAYRKH